MSFETQTAKAICNADSFSQLNYGKNVTEWLNDREDQVLKSNHSIDLTHIQKKKLKKNFYTPSPLDDQPICNLSSISSISSSPSHTCKDCLRTFKDINNYKVICKLF